MTKSQGFHEDESLFKDETGKFSVLYKSEDDLIHNKNLIFLNSLFC